MIVFILNFTDKLYPEFSGVEAIFSTIEKAENYKTLCEKENKSFYYNIYSVLKDPTYDNHFI